MNSSALGLETSSTFTGSARVSFQLWQLTTSEQKWIFFFLLVGVGAFFLIQLLKKMHLALLLMLCFLFLYLFLLMKVKHTISCQCYLANLLNY